MDDFTSTAHSFPWKSLFDFSTPIHVCNTSNCLVGNTCNIYCKNVNSPKSPNCSLSDNSFFLEHSKRFRHFSNWQRIDLTKIFSSDILPIDEIRSSHKVAKTNKLPESINCMHNIWFWGNEASFIIEISNSFSPENEDISNFILRLNDTLIPWRFSGYLYIAYIFALKLLLYNCLTKP